MKKLPAWLKCLNKIAIVLALIIGIAIVYQTAVNMSEMTGIAVIDILLLPFVLIASIGELLHFPLFVAAFLYVVGVYFSDIVFLIIYAANELCTAIKGNHSHMSRPGSNDNYYM